MTEIEDKWAKLGRQLGWDWGMADDEKRKRATKEQAAARDLVLAAYRRGAYLDKGDEMYCNGCGATPDEEHYERCLVPEEEARIQALGVEELTHDGD